MRLGLFCAKKAEKTKKPHARRLLRALCALAPLLLALCAFSCSTSVPVSVTRPAELDITDAETIAVLPFLTSKTMRYTSYEEDPVATFDFYWNSSSQNWFWGDAETELAQQITDKLERSLDKSNYLTVVSSAKVERAYRAHETPPIDWYVTGGVSKFKSRTEQTGTKEEERISRKGEKQRVKVPVFTRTVEMSLLYQVVDVRTGKVLSMAELEYEIESDELRSDDLPGELELAQTKLNDFTKELMKEFKPYNVRYKLTLLKHDDGAMKDAEKLAKKGKLALARGSYLNLYKTRGYFEAAYNAALLSQAMGELEAARDLFDSLYRETGDTRARAALTDVEYEINAAERLKAQQGE